MTTEPCLLIPRSLMASPGWRKASPIARSLLIDIAMSGPNGELTATVRSLRPLGWTGKATWHRALRNLIDCGLLVETRKGAGTAPSLYAAPWMEND